MFEIETHSVDCGVYKKPNVKIFTSQDTWKNPCSNRDDQLEV